MHPLLHDYHHDYHHHLTNYLILILPRKSHPCIIAFDEGTLTNEKIRIQYIINLINFLICIM